MSCLQCSRLAVGCLVIALAAPGAAFAQWVQFEDETATRLSSVNPGLGVSDPEEKDYAWGDLDRDGDIDLVVVRKQPFTSAGKKVAVLFMNENGVLTDRTSVYAEFSDVAGDLGFNTPTNNRDVFVVDVNNDNWLDVVTAPTISDGDPHHIGHPRVYRNRQQGATGWNGLIHEDGRIPVMLSITGQSGFNPRFCTVVAGDVTGDGFADLWFGDYDSSGAGGNSEPAGADFDDRLLINQGNGFFQDGTSSRFSGMISIPGDSPAPFPKSAFGAAGAIADMNGDGLRDIVKQTSLNAPTYVGIAYNRPNPNQGFFIASSYEVVSQQSPYFVSAGDLNNDGKKDLVITDDGADRYLLNQGNGTDGLANFVSTNFSYDAASDDGFGSNSVIADLNNDGWNDVLIADVDVDISGCNRRMHIYRNLGGTPGGSVVLQEQTAGTGCPGTVNPASCLVASIPSNMLEGVHDVAVFDINEDGWKDLVVGRCTGTQVYINQPPVGLAFSYPQGLPLFVPPGEPFTFQVQITGFGGTQHLTGTAKMLVNVGGSFSTVGLTHLGNGLYQATLPAGACADTIDFYFSAETTDHVFFRDPSNAPTEIYTALAATGSEVSFEDRMEGDVSGWSVSSDPSLTAGAWEVVDPVGAITGGGQQSAPDEDADASTSFVKAFVTQNGQPGGSANAADVDGGPTHLTSPPIALAGTDGVISYNRWFFSDGDDALTTWVSNNGTDWVLVQSVVGFNNSWQVASFKVGEYVEPSNNVRVRFTTGDNPNNDVAEAAIDAFRVERLVCSSGGAGRVPDGASAPGTPLTLDRSLPADITLSWGNSCSAADTDYEVYEGTVGNFTSHAQKLCTTGGATTATFTPGAGDTYYLIVPSDGVREGSYGVDSGGIARPPAVSACVPQVLGSCP